MDYLFDEHLKTCKQCREHPLETCAEGWSLLKRIVASPLPRPTKYALDAALVVPAEQLPVSVIVSAGEVDSQPRQ